MNIGSRIAAWFGGKKLPYDAEVEWLENANNQSGFLLGFKFTPTMSIDVSFIIRQQSTYTPWIVLSGSAWSQSFLRIQCDASYGGIALNAHSQTYITGDKNLGGEIIPEKRFRVVHDTSRGIEINGVNLFSGSFVNTNSPRVADMALFAEGKETGGLVSQSSIGLRICNCRVYEPNEGDLIDLIAVRKDGVGMFYDKVSGNFFGADKGFIIGPDKAANGGGNKCLISSLKSLWRRFSRVLRNTSKEVAR